MRYLAFSYLVYILFFSSCKEKEKALELSIISISPENGRPGSILTIIGTGFSTTPSENTVTFGSDEVTAIPGSVVEATPTRLSVIIPENISFQPISIFVKVGGVTKVSNAFLTASPIILKGEIRKDSLLKGNRTYLLEGIVVVKSGATLTIEPNTIIKGEKNTGGTLVIEKGARLIADGKSPSTPIIFTSDQARGGLARDFADWGGVVILGDAPVTSGNQPVIQALPGKPGFGGNNSQDNSGILKYVRIEFTGVAQPNTTSKLAGLTLAGVGNATILDFIEVSFADGNGFEFIGGNVNAKHLIAFSCKEDDFSIKEGYSGNLQYLLANKDPFVSSTSDLTDGLEINNSSPVIGNYTYIGAMALLRNARNLVTGEPAVSSKDGGNRVLSSRHGRGIYLSGSTTAAKIFNSVVIGASIAGIAMENNTATNYETNFGALIGGNAVLGSRESTLPFNLSRAAEFGIIKGFSALQEPEFFNHLPTGNEQDLRARNLREAFLSNNEVAEGAKDAVVTPEHSNQLAINVFRPWGVQQMIDYSSFNSFNPLPAPGPLTTGENNLKAPLLPNTLEDVAIKGAFGQTNWSAEWANFDPRQAIY